MITLDQRVHEVYPTVCFGVLCVQGFHAKGADAFRAIKEAEIASIRQQHANYERKEFIQTDPVSHYVRYYRGYKKTYHVLLQLESILLKDKTIPDAAPLVQALFLTEVKHMLLIAGHDLDAAVEPLTIGVAWGGERYTGTSGQEVELKPNDIYMRDAEGIIVSILYGQDNRTLITPETSRAVFLIDGVPGITSKRMMAGLEDLLRYVRAFGADVDPFFMEVLEADDV